MAKTANSKRARAEAKDALKGLRSELKRLVRAVTDEIQSTSLGKAAKKAKKKSAPSTNSRPSAEKPSTASKRTATQARKATTKTANATKRTATAVKKTPPRKSPAAKRSSAKAK